MLGDLRGDLDRGAGVPVRGRAARPRGGPDHVEHEFLRSAAEHLGVVERVLRQLLVGEGAGRAGGEGQRGGVTPSPYSRNIAPKCFLKFSSTNRLPAIVFS